MALSEAQLAFCAEWCEKHVTTWQVFRKGDWKYKWHGKTLVRYVDAVQVRTEAMSALLEYLTTDACVSTLALNKQGISGDWKPVNAWYEINQKPNGAIGGVRLYHALMVHPENGGDGPYVVENGCMWKVSWTFYWKQQSVIALPASSSGVNYRIANLNRDDENGTFNYVLEKRERVQQDIAEYETAKTTFETRTEEQHLGVRQEQVASTGKAASVSDGKMVQRRLRKNEDCTTDVINDTITEQPVPGATTETESRLRGTMKTTINRNMPDKASEADLPVGTSVRNEKTDGGRWTQVIREFAASVAGRLRAVCRKTVFRHTHATTTNVKNDPGFSHVESAGGGVIRETDVQKTEYDTFDVTDTETTDIPAPGAVTETRKFLDGTVTRTVNRNQPQKASEAGLGVGDSVRNEKTESGLWDQTIERASAEPVGRTGEACEQNALVHTHGRTEGVGRTPPESMEVVATAGSVVSRRARRTDRGAWEVTDETRRAKSASATAHGGAQKRTVQVTSFRNASEAPSETPTQNKEIEVSAQRNEFGLVDGTKRVTTFQEAQAQMQGGADKARVTVVVKRNTTSQNAEESPAQNKTVDVSITPNDHGSYDKTERVTDYSPAPTVTHGGTKLTEETRTVTANDTNINPTRTPEKGRAWEVTSSPNEHGSATTTVTERVAKPDQDLSAQWVNTSVSESATHVTTTRTRYATLVYRNQPSLPPRPDYQTVTASVHINEYGLLDVIFTCSSHVSTERVAISSSGSGGSQWDQHYNVQTFKYCIHNGRYYRKRFTADKRILVSTFENMMAEVGAGANRPDIGWVSGWIKNMDGKCAVIYSNIKEENWVAVQKLPATVTNVPNL